MNKEQVARKLAEQHGRDFDSKALPNYRRMRYLEDAEEICQLFEPKGEKPPVLDSPTFSALYEKWLKYKETAADLAIRAIEAQRDADVAWCKQAKAEVAREIFDILEEAFRNSDNRMGLFILSREWRALKDRFGVKDGVPKL